jgi:hypothetical protein
MHEPSADWPDQYHLVPSPQCENQQNASALVSFADGLESLLIH